MHFKYKRNGVVIYREMTVSYLAVALRGDRAGGQLSGAHVPGLDTVAQEFPTVRFGTGGVEELPSLQSLFLAAEEWESARFPFYEFDARVDGLTEPYLLRLSADHERLPGMALEVLTRCQRLVSRRNDESGTALFDRVLERHRDLHDLSKPLVRADWTHSLDVWQWSLRLDAAAGLEVQVAALFHDVERLVSEADVRVEHKALDYQRFKNEHAWRGAAMADSALAEAGIDPGTRIRVARLIEGHEHLPSPDDPHAADLALLNDADALSFFSLNSPGYLDYFGPEAAGRKIAWTMARLRPEARRRLESVRLRPDVAALLLEVSSR